MGKCMSKQKAEQGKNHKTPQPLRRHEYDSRARSASFGHPSLADEKYESVRGEDVEEVQISELNVLGENKNKATH